MNLIFLSPQRLSEIVRQPLPGFASQMKMAPSYRPAYNVDEIKRFNPKESAVLALFYPKNGDWHLVFTERKKYAGVHSGQMSFPGGKREGQEDLMETALRETHEEIGVPPCDIEVIGKLSELYIPPSNFNVQPFLAMSACTPTFIKQQKEVETVIEIPFSFFLEKSNKTNTMIPLPSNTLFEVPAFIFQDYVIWGATAIVLSEMIDLFDANLLD